MASRAKRERIIRFETRITSPQRRPTRLIICICIRITAVVFKIAVVLDPCIPISFFRLGKQTSVNLTHPRQGRFVEYYDFQNSSSENFLIIHKVDAWSVQDQSTGI